MLKVYHILFIFFIVLPLLAEGNNITPPEQPLFGPGGKDYQYNNVLVSEYGRDEHKYYIFEPDNYEDRYAPLIAFIHGWGATGPHVYRLWIDHLVKKGNIVVYPVYQKAITGPDYYTFFAANAIKDAITKLYIGYKHIKPNINNFGIIGHSAGGIIAANLATMSTNDITMPRAKFVLSVEPGISTMPPERVRNNRENINTYTIIPLYDLREIRGETFLVTIVGGEDNNVFDYDAKRIYNGTSNIPLNNKDYIIMHSDYYSNPPLIADHYAPLALQAGSNPLLEATLKRRNPALYEQLTSRAAADALDFFCLWKLSDILIDMAFYNRNFEYFNGSHLESYMGVWSDGTNVKELTIYSNEVPNN